MKTFNFTLAFFLHVLTMVTLEQYDKCSLKLDITVCTSGEPPSTNLTYCNKSPVCEKDFKLAYINNKPYSADLVADIVTTCCGTCSKTSVIKNLTKVSEITFDVMESSDFVFPVLGRQNDDYLYGYRYIPFIATPNVYYVTHRRSNFLRDLVTSCLNMWPLMVICALMVLISGFVCWVMETWGNVTEFPRPFLIGWFEGVWWSFISMTTVGYGDKTPKSVPARLFSVIWIVIGITTFSLVTATLTSEIIAANAIPPPSMKNANVGTVRYHLYEAILIMDQGGIMLDIEQGNVTDGIKHLINMLKKNIVDGFVLDRYELMLFYGHFSDHVRYKDDVNYLRTKTVLTEVRSNEQFFYGFLVKDENDYRFLNEYMKNNRDVINSCTSLFLSMYSRELHVEQEKPSLFSTEGGLFWPSFIFCTILIAAMMLCGATYECRRNKYMPDWSCGGLTS